MAEPYIGPKNLHPTVICKGYARALEDACKIVERMSFPIDVNDRAQMLNVVNSCIATKFTHRFGTLMAVRRWDLEGACLGWASCRDVAHFLWSREHCVVFSFYLS